jgi:multiple sugar transport system ATP-binding protein
MAEVVLTNVHKSYGNVVAVKDFSLDIADEEFVVLVGPSGCGKSTTLRMIAGLEDITGGTIAIGGRVVNDLQPKDRDIAMVFQNYALYQHMSVYDNLAFGLRNRRTPQPQIDAAIRRAAKVLSIEPLLDRRPRQLSGGQQQRVALGRCIVRNPKVFLFDEPLSNLDAQLRAQMRLELKELRQRVPTTSIFVTHDQVEAMTLGDRIVVMKDGLVQQVGTPLELYRRPVNRFVASFIGSPAMNFFEMTAEGSADAIRLTTDGLAITLPPARFPDLARNSAVTVGVRPQHLRLGRPESADQVGLSGALMVTEQLGDEQLLAIRIGGGDIRVAGVDHDARHRHHRGGDSRHGQPAHLRRRDRDRARPRCVVVHPTTWSNAGLTSVGGRELEIPRASYTDPNRPCGSRALAAWHAIAPQCQTGDWLFFPQSRLAQALHVQLLHPLVAEALKPERSKRSVGLVFDEFGDLGPRLAAAAKLGKRDGHKLAGGVVLRRESQRTPAGFDALLKALREIERR